MNILKSDTMLKVTGLILLVGLIPRFIRPREMSYYFRRFINYWRGPRNQPQPQPRLRWRRRAPLVDN